MKSIILNGNDEVKDLEPKINPNTSEQQEAVRKTHLYKPLQQQRAACQP